MPSTEHHDTYISIISISIEYYLCLFFSLYLCPSAFMLELVFLCKCMLCKKNIQLNQQRRFMVEMRGITDRSRTNQRRSRILKAEQYSYRHRSPVVPNFFRAVTQNRYREWARYPNILKNQCITNSTLRWKLKTII